MKVNFVCVVCLFHDPPTFIDWYESVVILLFFVKSRGYRAGGAGSCTFSISDIIHRFFHDIVKLHVH